MTEIETMTPTEIRNYLRTCEKQRCIAEILIAIQTDRVVVARRDIAANGYEGYKIVVKP